MTAPGAPASGGGGGGTFTTGYVFGAVGVFGSPLWLGWPVDANGNYYSTSDNLEPIEVPTIDGSPAHLKGFACTITGNRGVSFGFAVAEAGGSDTSATLAFGDGMDEETQTWTGDIEVTAPVFHMTPSATGIVGCAYSITLTWGA